MKRFILVTGLLAAAWGTASGQGTVTSANSSASVITNYLTMTPAIAGTAFKVALYYLPDTGVTPSVWGGIFEPDPGWIMLGPTVNVGPVAGYYSTGTRTTPSTTPPGGAAWFQVRVWEAVFGATFEDAWTNPNPIGGRGMLGTISNVMKVTTGNPTTTPPGSPGAATPIGFIPLIPEPSALGLGLLGAVLLLVARRRRSQSPLGRCCARSLTKPVNAQRPSM